VALEASVVTGKAQDRRVVSSEAHIAEAFTTWVNLSGRQLSRGGVARMIADTLEHHKLPANLLGVEVTETILVQGGAAGARSP
jgi:EAL domain-containing protein (putative c-di-GMP-specific phosphodiesterase class I)